jgi:NADPH2:quinone reductase
LTSTLIAIMYLLSIPDKNQVCVPMLLFRRQDSSLAHLWSFSAMKTVRFHSIGDPDVMVYEDVPDPVPGQGEVLIRVEAVGVNFADVLRRRGDPYPEPSPTPFTLGGEVAGTIAALGDGVTGLPVGTPVFATTRVGGYAQYVVMPAERVVPLPEGVSAAQATALVVQGLTAYFALKDAARIKPGESVLVEAAAGGVGGFAVQLARLLGAGKIIAAASTEEKRAYAMDLGADYAVDYTDPQWPSLVKDLTGGKGVDIVLEMVGGETVHRAIETMGPFARMIVYGQSSGEAASVDPQQLVNLNQSMTGFYIAGYFAHPELIVAALGEIISHVSAGRLSLQVGLAFPLSKAAEAHRLLEGRKTTGKVVLEPWNEG